MVSHDDVIRIADIINAENDKWICFRISYELALDGDSGCDDQTEPLLVRGIEAINEKLVLSKDYEIRKCKLKKISKNLESIKTELSDRDLADILDFALDEKQNLNTDHFVEHIECIQKSIELLLFDNRKNRKLKNKDWGDLGYYKVFIADVINLYTSLTGLEFKVDFLPNSIKGSWEPLTSAGLFVYQFHLILNKVAKAYSCEPFTDANFKNTCSAVRTEINRKK